MMRALSRMIATVRNLFHTRQVESDLDAEIRTYVDVVTEERIAAGMTPETARRTALAEFGGTEQVKQAVRDSRAGTGIETLWRDVQFAIRILRKSPGFATVVILTLALGIGANTAIFTLVNAVLLQTIPVTRPEELVVMRWSAHKSPESTGMSSFGDCVMRRDAGDESGCSMPYPVYRTLAERRDVFANVTAFAGTAELDLAGNGQASIARGELVSGTYFDTLGVPAALGRTLGVADEQNGASAVAVLDYGYWQRMFGGARGVLGRTIRLNNLAFTIVGVADRGFTRLTPGKLADLYVSVSQTKALGLRWGGHDDPGSWWVTVVGRLNPGMKRTQAEAAANLAFRNATMNGTKPAWRAADDPRLVLVPSQEGLSGFRRGLGEPLRLLMAAVGIVLLIACANVAGLMLARSTSRERELAVRFALGASRRRVMQQLLTESVLLSLAGTALGTLLAYAGASALAAFTSANWYQPLHIDVRPDARVLLFTIGVALVTGIGFGLAPALRGARTRSAVEMSRGTTEGSPLTLPAGPRWPGLGSTLVVVQVALSIVMLTGAGLLFRTLDKLRSVDAGFDTRNVLLLGVNPTLAGYDKPRLQAVYDNLQQRLAALPGVVSVSYSSDALLDGSLWTEDVKVEGQTSKQTVDSQMLRVGPHYFETMRLPLLRGRSLGPADIRGGPPAAVVNEAFVRKFLEGRDPIGLHFGSDDKRAPQWAIVGVARDAKYNSLQDEDAPTAYVPLDTGGATFELRTTVAPAGFIPAVRKTVQDVDDNVPVIQVRTQSESIGRLLFNQRLMARLLGGFAVLGLGLACIGLYGLLSYEVARRTREIGVRTALGAQRRDVLALFLRRGLVVVLLGSVVGVGAAAMVTRLLASLLYGVRALDPLTFLAAAVLLAAVGLVACCLPASRALRVDPAVALRCE
ncbi:MAG TPA: ABC transporter permease [Terracidiphilus sp.]|nr:ABC transporter permease [Terracidiphilus sp.]